MFVRYRTFHDKLHLRQYKAIDLVKTFLVTAVGTKETVLALAFKGDTKIVSRAVERCAHIVEQPYHRVLVGRVARCFEEVQSTVSGMAVTCKIQRPIGVNVRIHLVRGGVDALTQRLGIDPFAVIHLGAPYILTSHTARVVAHKVQGVSRRIQRRVTDCDRTVGKQLHLLRLTPFTTRAFTAEDLGTQVLTVNRLRIGEQHRAAVFGEATNTHLCHSGRLTTTGRVVLLFFLFTTVVQALCQHNIFP